MIFGSKTLSEYHILTQNLLISDIRVLTEKRYLALILTDNDNLCQKYNSDKRYPFRNPDAIKNQSNAWDAWQWKKYSYLPLGSKFCPGKSKKVKI